MSPETDAHPEPASGDGGGITLGAILLSLALMGVLMAALFAYVLPGVNQGAAERRVLDADDAGPGPVSALPAEPVDLSGVLNLGIWVLIVLVVVGTVVVGGHQLTAVRAQRRRELTSRENAWEAVRGRHLAARLAVASFETDPAKAITYPAFNDVTVPEVSALAKTMRTAQDLESATDRNAPVGGSDRLLGAYREAVAAFETTVATAERAAQRIAWSHLSDEERKDLRLAQHLLAQASDTGNTDEARTTFYARLQTVVRRLNDRHPVTIIPAVAVVAIEEKARPALEAAD
jgi:hypothetical protein